MIKTFKDLQVYELSYELALEIFTVSKKFPKEELYSLTNQIGRASRSVAANIAEGWAKRKYKNVFIRHLIDANGSCEEVKVWLDFSKDFGYLEQKNYNKLIAGYNKVGAMIFGLVKNWRDL